MCKTTFTNRAPRCPPSYGISCIERETSDVPLDDDLLRIPIYGEQVLHVAVTAVQRWEDFSFLIIIATIIQPYQLGMLSRLQAVIQIVAAHMLMAIVIILTWFTLHTISFDVAVGTSRTAGSYMMPVLAVSQNPGYWILDKVWDRWLGRDQD